MTLRQIVICASLLLCTAYPSTARSHAADRRRLELLRSVDQEVRMNGLIGGARACNIGFDSAAMEPLIELMATCDLKDQVYLPKCSTA